MGHILSVMASVKSFYWKQFLSAFKRNAIQPRRFTLFRLNRNQVNFYEAAKCNIMQLTVNTRCSDAIPRVLGPVYDVRVSVRKNHRVIAA